MDKDSLLDRLERLLLSGWSSWLPENQLSFEKPFGWNLPLGLCAYFGELIIVLEVTTKPFGLESGPD